MVIPHAVTEAATTDEILQQAARVNSMDNFKPVWERLLESLFIDRLDGNEEIVERVLNDPAFRRVASDQMMQDVYTRLRLQTAS